MTLQSLGFLPDFADTVHISGISQEHTFHDEYQQLKKLKKEMKKKKKEVRNTV